MTTASKIDLTRELKELYNAWQWRVMIAQPDEITAAGQMMKPCA